MINIKKTIFISLLLIIAFFVETFLLGALSVESIRLSRLHAYQTDMFFLNDEGDYNKGDFKNTQILKNSFLALVPGCEVLTEVNELVLWDVEHVRDKLIVASGHSGKVYVLSRASGKLLHSIQLGSDGKSSDQKTLEVTSIVSTDDKTVFVSAGPGGSQDEPKAFIYKLSDNYKNAKLFATVPTEFIWSMTYNKKFSICGDW